MNAHRSSAHAPAGLAQALLAASPGPPIGDFRDFALADVEYARAVPAAVRGRPACNPAGAIHGGLAATLLESARGIAAARQPVQDRRFTAHGLEATYHKAMTGRAGEVQAEGEAITLAGRVAFVEAHLKDAGATPNSPTTSTLLAMPT